MGFVKKTWKDRLVEFAGRRRLIDVDTGTEQVVDILRNEGLVSQEGDAFSAKNMNDLEERIDAAFGGMSLKKCSQAEYDGLGANKKDDIIYIIVG